MSGPAQGMTGPAQGMSGPAQGRPLRIILASASPRRRQLLKTLKIPFRVIPSHIPEVSRFRDPVRQAKDLALQKARAIARTRQEGLVLGADTIVVLRGKILGKPADEAHACRMLSALSGSTHRVYTGIALVDAATGRALTHCAASVVRMKRIPPEQLARLARRHHDKAGAYAIQEKRDPIARVIKGSYDNVVGLPVSDVKALLRKLVPGA